MFEAYILGLLQEYLGAFVKAESLQKDRLRADVYNGHVCLEKLELNASCLDFLNLPLSLVKGYIGQIEFKVSGGNWSNLVNSARIEVVIDHVYMLIGPKFSWTDKEKESRGAYVKETRLRRAELFAINRHSNSELSKGEAESGGFFARLGTRLVDNIEVLVRNVHVRYEDHVSRPARPFAFGFVLDSLRMNSTDENWGDAYVDRASRLIAAVHKRIRLSQFAVYCNPVADDLMFKNVNVPKCSYDEWARLFQPPSLSNNSNTKRVHHMLRPVDAQVFLKMADDTFDTTGEPHTTASIQVSNISLVVEESQYHNLLYLVSSFEGHSKRARYAHLRPKCRVLEDPRQWWQYAFEAARMDSRERSKAYSPAFVAQRRRDRLMYMKLWRRKCVGNSLVTEADDAKGAYPMLTDDEKGALGRLEHKLTVEDVLFFRSLADAELERTREERELFYRELAEENSAKGAGVLGYFFGGGGARGGSYYDRNSSAVPALSATERAKVFNDLGYDPTRGISKYDFPADFVYQHVEFEIGSLNLEIVSTEAGDDDVNSSMLNDSSFAFDADQSMRSSSSSTQSARVDPGEQGRGEIHERVFQASFAGLTIGLKSRVESQRIEIQLESIKAVDPQTHPTRVEYRVVQRRDLGGNSSMVMDDLFLNLVLDVNPPKKDVEGALALQMQPLEIVYSASCWDRMLGCFQVPAEMDTWEQLQSVAIGRVESLEANAAAKFEYAMSNHVRFDLDLKVAAPVIIVPENRFGDDAAANKRGSPWSHTESIANILVCDLGQMAFSSMDMSRSKSYGEDDEHVDENEEFYDHYQLRMSDMQVVLLKSLHFHTSNDRGDGVLRSTYDHTKATQVVEKFGCTINLQTSILPFDRTITRVKVWSLLPSLRVQLTTRSYKTLLQLVQSYEKASPHDQGGFREGGLGKDVVRPSDDMDRQMRFVTIDKRRTENNSLLARARRMSRTLNAGNGSRGRKIDSKPPRQMSKAERRRKSKRKKRSGKGDRGRKSARTSSTTESVNWRLLEASLLIMDARLDVYSSTPLVRHYRNLMRRGSMKNGKNGEVIGTHIVRLRLNNLSMSTAVRSFSTELRLSLYGLQVEDKLRKHTASNITKYLVKSFSDEDGSGARKLVSVTLVTKLPLPKPEEDALGKVDDCDVAEKLDETTTNVSLAFDNLMLRCQQHTLAALVSVFVPNVERKYSRRKSSLGTPKVLSKRSIFLSPGYTASPASKLSSRRIGKRSLYSSSGIESSPGFASAKYLGQSSSNEDDVLSHQRRQRKQVRESTNVDNANSVVHITSISITLQGVELFFDDDNARLGCIALGLSTVDVDISESATKSTFLKGKLGNLSLIDLTRVKQERAANTSDHSVEIFGLRDDTATSLVVFDISQDEENGTDISLKMTSVKCVLLAPFILKMAAYVTDGALARGLSSGKARAASADYPRENRSAVVPKETQPKVNFDVQLDNPLVIIPRAASSPDMFVVDLGKISLRNTFHEDNGDAKQVIFLKFVEIHIRCGSEKIMDDHNAEIKVTLGNNNDVLADVNFTAIHVGVSQDHLSLMVGIWLENLGVQGKKGEESIGRKDSNPLASPAVPSPQVPPTTPKRKESMSSPMGSTGSFAIGEPALVELPEQDPSVDVPTKKLALNMTFKALQLELFDSRGGSRRKYSESSVSTALHASKSTQQLPSFRSSLPSLQSIAMFTITKLELNLEDVEGLRSYRRSKLALETLGLQDSRNFSSNSFRDIISPIASAGSSITLVAHEDLATGTVNVEIDIPMQYRFALVPSAINSVMAYFNATTTETMAAVTTISSAPRSSAPSRKVKYPADDDNQGGYLPQGNIGKDSPGLLTMSASNSGEEGPSLPTNRTVTVVLKKFNPEIWLLEDATLVRCPALVVTSFVSVMATFRGVDTELQSMTFTAENCSVINRSVTLGPEVDPLAKAINIISPFKVEVGVKLLAFGSDHDEDDGPVPASDDQALPKEKVANVQLSSIVASLGYHDVRLASLISTTWSTPNFDDDDDLDTLASQSDTFSDSDYGSSSRASTMYSRGFRGSSRIPPPFETWDDRSSSAGASRAPTIAGTEVYDEMHQPNVPEDTADTAIDIPLGNLLVVSDSFKVTLTNDLYGQNTPLAEVSLKTISGLVESTQELIHGKLGFKFGADYHNLKLMAWEPFIEPWSATVDVAIPRTICCGSSKTPPVNGADNVPPVPNDSVVSATVKTDATCNINITEALLENVAAINRGVKWITSTPEKDVLNANARSQFSLYHVFNYTGMPLMFWKNDGTTVFLQNGEESPLDVHDFANQTGQTPESAKANKFLMVNVLNKEECDSMMSGNAEPGVKRIKLRRASTPAESIQSTFVPQRLRIDALGAKVYDLRLSERGEAPESAMGDVGIPISSICVNVVSQNGSKLVYINSGMFIRNETKQGFSATWTSSQSQGSEEWSIAIQPGETIQIPASLPLAKASINFCPLSKSSYTKQVSSVSTAVSRAMGNGGVAAWPMRFVKQENVAKGILELQVRACMRVDRAAETALHIKSRDSSKKNTKRYFRLLSLHPSLVLQNCTPQKIRYEFSLLETRAEGSLVSGKNVEWEGVAMPANVTNSNCLSIRICLPGCDWTDPLQLLHENISAEQPLLTSVIACDRRHREMVVQVEIRRTQVGSLHVSVFLPYWINNLTGLPLIFSHKSASRRNALVACQPDERSTGETHALIDESQSQALFLGTGPRKLGLRELLPGKNGELVPALMEARMVGMVEPRSGVRRKMAKDAWNGHPENLILMDFSNTQAMTSRVSVRLARGMNSTHASSTFTTLLPTEWSRPFALDSAGTTGEIEIPEAKSVSNILMYGERAAYSLGVSIGLGNGPFAHTRVVTIASRFLLVNHMGRPLLVKQEGASAERYVASGSSDRALLVRPGTQCPFHWVSSRVSQRRLTVRFDEYGWEFCSGFDITHVGSFSLNIRNPHAKKHYIARVNIEQQGPTLVVTFEPELPRMPPYRIENTSFETLRFFQENVEDAEQVLLPYKSAKYTWDDLSGPRLLVLYATGGSSEPHPPIHLGTFSMDKIDDYTHLPGALPLRVSVLPDGPTKVLRVIDSRVEKVAAEIDGRRSSRSSLNRRRRRTRRGSNLSRQFPNAKKPEGFRGSRGSMHSQKPFERRRSSIRSGTSVSPPRYRKSSFSKSKSPLRKKGKNNAFSSSDTKRGSSIVQSNFSLELNLQFHGLGISLVDAAPRELMYVHIGQVRLGLSRDAGYIRCHATIGNLQIDNQLHSTRYPVLLFTGSDIRPSEEADHAAFACDWVSKRAAEITFVESLSVGITPVDLNVDGNLVSAIYEMLTRVGEDFLSVASKDATPSLMPNGGAVNRRRRRRAMERVDKRIYFQLFEVESLDVHISFSSGTGGVASSILRNLGATLTRIENAPLRLNGIVLRHAYETADTLVGSIAAQYKFDALRQAYVILGSSELLGNPISLFKHLGTGVRDFFYEPVSGLRSGFFLRGILNGTTSLFQNTVVGLSMFAGKFVGSIARMTPAVFGFRRFLRGVEGAAIALGGSVGALEKEKRRMKRIRPPRVFADPHLHVYDREAEEGDEILSRVSNGMYWGEGYSNHCDLHNGTLLVLTYERAIIVSKHFEELWEVRLSEILDVTVRDGALVVIFFPRSLGFKVDEKILDGVEGEFTRSVMLALLPAVKARGHTLRVH